MNAPTVAPNARYDRESALKSLADVDPEFVTPPECAVLARPENDHLLGYVSEEAFTHVFPGDRPVDDPREFFADLDGDLRRAESFHLWTYLPLCLYRCHFCQFPVLVVNRNPETAMTTARRWVDANIAEARLWLERVPALRKAHVGEFCLFGGTPTALPMAELARLVDFYVNEFNVDERTSWRAEGSPDTLSEPILIGLRALGFDKLTYGIQSFEDELLELANRRHTAQQAAEAAITARRVGFVRVDGDLVWGLPGQSVRGFAADVQRMLDLDFSTIVMTKLHLRPFDEVDVAIGHVSAAPWMNPAVRQRIADTGWAWPSLGRQYQMRRLAVDMVNAAGYFEHPTTYFPRQEIGPPIWRSLNLDHHRQAPQIGIGLGGYTWSSRSEANIAVDPAQYLAAIANDELPLTSITAVTAESREVRAVRMALSTCQPLNEQVHRSRFPDSSLFSEKWAAVFARLEARGLATVDRPAREVALTREGQTLVEAIINTEII